MYFGNKMIKEPILFFKCWVKRPKNLELVGSMEVAFKLRFSFLAFNYRVVMIFILVGVLFTGFVDIFPEEKNETK